MIFAEKLLKKVIIFDDDILSICIYILEEQGWHVHAYSDCNDVIKRVSDIKPSVILMDNWIPEEGGVLATRRLKAADNLKQIPVIYFSANSDIQALAADAGAEFYLAKPFDIDELINAVNTTARVV